MSAKLLRDIICNEEEVRHTAYKNALSLPAEKSLPILRKGLRHWDRKLRNKCARSIINLSGTKAASLILPLYAKGLLYASSSSEPLRAREDETLIKYLIRNKGKKDALARAAQALYQKTEYYETKQEEIFSKKQALRESKEHAKLKTATSKSLDAKPPSDVDPSLQDVIHFLSELKNENHRRLLYYEWSRENTLDSFYSTHNIPKKSGGERQINTPHPVLKMAQRALLLKLTDKARLHENCHGFRVGKSIISNATFHIGKPIVVNLDLKDFFPTITSKRVYGIFRALGYKGQELRFLTDMTTYKRRLPQGAPTSPMLANIACVRLDNRLTGLAKKIGSHYTRYADDITFSGPEKVIRYIPVIKKIIGEEGFLLALPKLRIHRKGARQEVTGLTVNEQVSVPRAIRRRLRAAVHRVKNNNEPFWKGQNLEMQSLKGYLWYLASVHPEQARKMLHIIP